jgi:hypothetical protein
MLPAKFRFIWPSGFRGEDILEINQSETIIACAGHVCYRIGTKCSISKHAETSKETNYNTVKPDHAVTCI